MNTGGRYLKRGFRPFKILSIAVIELTRMSKRRSEAQRRHEMLPHQSRHDPVAYRHGITSMEDMSKTYQVARLREALSLGESAMEDEE